MPYRKVIFTPDEIYHVYNRSVAKQPIFVKIKDLQRAFELIDYYRFSKTPLRYSHYIRLPLEQRNSYLQQLLSTANLHVEILAFCIMPNHFHLLLKEKMERGLSTFMRNVQNSYAKYFNTKYNRSGSLFQAMFKSVRIESDEQFLHVNRYIHLNPLTSFLLKNFRELEKYPWTSYIDYIGNRHISFITKKYVLKLLSLEKFKTFTLDQVNYQKQLAKIKHLTLEKPYVSS